MGLATLVAGWLAVERTRTEHELGILELQKWQAEVSWGAGIAQSDEPNNSNEPDGALAGRFLGPGEPAEEPVGVRIFRQTVRATALDLFGTGHLEVSRARGLAEVIVTEATKRGVPVPLVLGVMRVENNSFKSRAKSVVGAMGLMQIMPKVWLPSYGKKYGWDLENDTTNIKMGISILAIYLKNNPGDWRTALLRYNGCVRGTNTPRCWTYPEKVKRAAEQDARWLCGGQGFEDCMVGAGYAPERRTQSASKPEVWAEKAMLGIPRVAVIETSAGAAGGGK